MAISPETQRVLDNYAASVGGVQDTRYVNIISVIQNSPSLEHALNQATRDGTIRSIHFDPALANQNMAGTYTARSQTVALGNAVYAKDKLVFTLAHEVQHANYSRHKQQEYVQIQQDIRRVASDTRNSVHDYSPIIHRGLQQNRQDEARAQIAGWNAYVEYQRNTNPVISEQQLLIDNPYRDSISFDSNVYDRANRRFIQTLHPDLQFNADLTLAATPANTEAMGRHFYDPSQGLGGATLNLNYQHYYADFYVEAVALAENDHRSAYRAANRGREAQVRIDMQSLGLDEQKMEAQGLSIPGGRLNYTDATHPSRVVHSALDGVARPNVRYNPVIQAGEPQRPEQNLTEPVSGERHRLHSHPELLPLSQQFAAALPHLSEEQHNQLAAYCGNRCAREKMPVQDIGELIFDRHEDGRNLVYALNKEGTQFVSVNVDKALNTPVEQSLNNLNQAQQEQIPSQQMLMEQQQAQQQTLMMRM